ncbi:MAG TPA: chemotaxis protein CheW, partial [Burkholderiaceae bacterium]|nr:chemotaxis protein CheW [Burkholderiaceae bacterium]
MRALPVEVLPNMPSFMSGVSMIRGSMVPVVNLAMLLGMATNRDASRYVTVRLNKRRVAFLVDSVDGVGQLAADLFQQFPPLLGNADQSILAAVGTLDADLFLVLEASRVIPESVWQTLDLQGFSS